MQSTKRDIKSEKKFLDSQGSPNNSSQSPKLDSALDRRQNQNKPLTSVSYKETRSNPKSNPRPANGVRFGKVTDPQKGLGDEDLSLLDGEQSPDDIGSPNDPGENYQNLPEEPQNNNDEEQSEPKNEPEKGKNLEPNSGDVQKKDILYSEESESEKEFDDADKDDQEGPERQIHEKFDEEEEEEEEKKTTGTLSRQKTLQRGNEKIGDNLRPRRANTISDDQKTTPTPSSVKKNGLERLATFLKNPMNNNNKVVPISPEQSSDMIPLNKDDSPEKTFQNTKLENGIESPQNGAKQQGETKEPTKTEKKQSKPSSLPKKSHKENISEKERIHRSYVLRRQKVNKAINCRKMARFMWLLIYCALFGIIIGGGMAYLIEENSFDSYPNANLSFNLDKCTLFISDHTESSIKSSVYATYEVPRKIDFKNFTSVDINLTSNPQRITVYNPYEEEYCKIYLYVKNGTSLGSLNISCSDCNIIQDTSFQLQITSNVSIVGSMVHANFRNIQTGLFTYEALTGYLQLNNIDATSTSNTIKLTNQGDIIIQSTQDFKVDATTDTQAFCFNGPSVQKVSAANCAISGDSTTYSSINNTGCQVVYDICASSSCTASRPKYTVSSIQGNIYANMIPSVGQPVASGNTPKYGRTYDNGIGLNGVAQGTINGLNEMITQNPNSGPFAILHLGDIESQSSRYTKWVLASNPSYALMRPWWVSTFSVGLLNGNKVQGKGILLPGYCPFIPEYTMDNLLEVQQLLRMKTTTDTVLVTFVNDKEMPLPPANKSSSTGIFHYVKIWASFDNWYSLAKSTTGEVFLKNNDFTDKSIILAAIIVSFAIAGIISFHTVQLVIYAILHMYTKLTGFANHLKTFSKLDQSKAQKALEDNKTNNQNKKPDEEIQRKNFKNLIKRSPSPSAFIDYLVLIIYRQLSDSVSQYYHLLFKEVEESQINDQELDPGRDLIRGNEAKILYEKFCFLNYLYEKKLTHPKNVLLLQKYGFEIVDREDLPTEVFVKINIKNYDNFLVNPAKEGENLNSLEMYVRENVEITEFEEDQVEVDTFINIYNKFCDYNRLPRIIISPSLMKDVFNINMVIVRQQFIMRKAHQGNDLLQRTLWNRISVCLKRFSKKKKTYIIDTSRLENHFKLIMDKITDFANDDELDEATVDLILYPNWIIWDGVSVLFHLFQWIILVAPTVALVMLNESEYSLWSLKDPAKLITFLDLIRDPANLVVNLYTCSFWNMAMMILASVLWVISFFDLLLYYWVMEFPQDKSFRISIDQGELFLRKIGRQVEWVLVLIFLAIYFSYAGVLLTWLMFGALIDPNNFLPFATAAATFTTFVWTKYKFFKNLASKGEEAVMNYLRELFGGFLNKILSRLTESLENITKEALSEGKAFLQSKTFKDTANSLVERGLVDPKTIAEYTQKIENLDSKTVISEAGVIINDPGRAIREMGSTLFSLKGKIVEKVKEECEKREIPPSLVDIIICVALKDSAGVKNAVKAILVEYGTKLNMPKESIDIAMELLFSQCINKEEKIKFITNKIIEMTFNKLNISGLSPEMFILMFDNFSNLQEMKLDSFVSGIKELLKELKESNDKKENKNDTISKIQPFIHALDIISALSEGRADFWRLKHPSLNLLCSVISHWGDEKKGDETKKTIKNFAKFLLLISSNFEVPSDLDTNQPLESQDIDIIIKDFCTSIGLAEKHYEGKPFSEIVAPLIHLAISYSKHETVALSKDVIKDLEALLDLKKLGRNDFIPFCLELTTNIFVDQRKFYKQMHKCCENFKLNEDLSSFIKVLTCYGFDDYETYCPNIKIDQNPYFVKIADNLKVPPTLLLGLFDLLYHRYYTKGVKIFLKAILSRMGLNEEKLRCLYHILYLFLSEDEEALLQAAKSLRLNYSEFLLVGKGLLNPRFIETEKYTKLGIQSYADKKNIYNFPEEHYSRWKSTLRKEIEESVNASVTANEAKPLKEQERIEAERIRAEKNLVKFYLEDWKTHSFSRKKLADYLNILDNEKNNIRKMLLSQEKGTLNTGVDFLVTCLSLKNIQLPKKRRYKLFNKEKDHAVSTLADCLSVNSESMKKFIQMLVLSDVNEVVNCFLHFFPKEQENKIVIKKVLSYTFRSATILRGQINFLTKELPQKIEFVTNKHLNIPNGFFSKIFYDSSKVSFKISDVLEMSSLLVTDANEKNQEVLMKKCYTLARFSKGLLPSQRISSEFKVNNKKIIKIIKLLSIPDRSIRMRLLVKLFKDKYDPLKVMIAFHGLLTQADFQVCTPKTTYSGFKKTEKYEEESIKSYLANFLDLYPEALGIFDLAFERNVSKFIQKALPIIRRVNGSSFVDVNLMESLLSLSVGEHFNTTYIANRLDISPDIISFFVSLTRLAYNPKKKDNIQIRKKELNDLAGSVSAKKVLTKLKIKPLELVAILRLLLNVFDTNATVADAIGDLGLKRNLNTATEKSFTIDVELMKGLFALDKSFKPEANLFENKKVLQALKSKTNSFFSLVGLGANIDNAFIVSRLVAGNFLVLLDYSQKLDWAFPYKDLIAGPLIRSVIMSICGLVNVNSKVEDNLHHKVEHFVRNLHSLDLEEFAKKEHKFQTTDKILPNNTLAYAISLAYKTLDIAPVWIQAFLFDKTAYEEIKNNTNLHPEFILVIVLNIIHMPDIFGDLWGLYEWNLKCKEFCENVSPSWNDDCKKTKKTDIYEELCLLLGDKMTFDYGKVVELAKASEIAGKRFWKDLLVVKDFNRKMNESLLYLLIYNEKENTKGDKTIQQMNKDIQIDFIEKRERFDKSITKHPVNFIVMYVRQSNSSANSNQESPEDDKFSTTDLNQTTQSGSYIQKILAGCYKCVASSFLNDPVSSGYELTNFCMLGTVVNLRNSLNLKMSYERILYNLHQLSANVERKLYLNPYFVKMSKFKLMKLVGVSLCTQISNIVEWCLPPSLFSPDYVAKLDREVDKEKQNSIMVEQCKKVALTYTSNEIILGDLGTLGGTYEDYNRNISRLVKADDWDSTSLLLSLTESYEGHIEEDSERQKRKERDLFEKCCVPDLQKIYYSKELMSQMYKKEQTDKSKDWSAKTGLKYDIEQKRSLAFETAIMDPNMMLIMGVTVGDLSVLSRGEHIISAGEDGKKKARIYRALFGLKSFRKSHEKERKQLKEYLAAIASVTTIESDISKLEEIIMLIVTGKVSINEMLNALEISDPDEYVLDLLFMSLKEESNELNNYDYEDTINPREVIAGALDIQENDLETFNLIRNVYLLNKRDKLAKDGWVPLVRKLRKDPHDKVKREKAEILINLIAMLDFQKIRDQAGTSQNQEMINFFKFKEKDIDKVSTNVFKEAVLLHVFPHKEINDQKQPVNKKDGIKIEFLLKAYEIVQNLINCRKSKLFELILLNPQTDQNTKSVFARLLGLFGISRNSKDIQNDIKILKIFLTIGNGDLTAFQSQQGYEDVIVAVIADLTNSGFMLGVAEDKKKTLSELLVGSLIWDIKVIIKSFISTETLKQGYLLYNIYGCLFLNRLLAYGPKYTEQIKTHLKVLLSTVVKKIMSPATASEFLKNEANKFKFDDILKGFTMTSKTSEGSEKQLKKDFDELIQAINGFGDKKQPKSLFSHICRYFNAEDSQTLTLWDPLEKKEYYELVFDIMTYFCDGSIVVRLLNTVVKNEEVRDLIWKLVRFALVVMDKLFVHPNADVSIDDVLKHLRGFIECLKKFKEDKVWQELLKITEYIMKIYLTYHSNKNSNSKLEKSKIEILKVVKDLLMFYIKDEKQRKLFFNLVSVVLGLNMEKFDETGPSLKFDLTSKERMELFFVKVLPAIFPSLEKILSDRNIDFKESDFEQIYDLITRLTTEYIYNLHNPQKLREIVKDLAGPLEKYAGCNRKLTTAIIKLMEGDLSGFKDLAQVFLSGIDNKNQSQSQIAKKVERMVAYLNNIKDIMDFDYTNKLFQPIDGKMANLNNNNKVSQESWNAIIKKVKEGTASPKELFDILDLSGNSDGNIDEKEFTSLAFRLGFKLSQHRIKEIIAKVKGTEARPGTEHQLNEKEFQEALKYLQTKNLQNALQILNISPEQLTVIFVWLVILLILIFVFIFLGIKAFAVGGTFGSIINSLFPAAGGLALGKNKDANKEIINKKNVEGASDTAFKITAFEEL